ncbi:MAG: glutathione peroxidase [Gammaproteobacteria bacterium]|jgi:glutathione peroxidase|nr:MAG: glutathione peroxidase [Gammaproteobacteria bacterium]|tara:strand:- start:133 stop:639 length:507 start_codon:yes stop_codon:yes gene_type:complete
MRPLREKFMKSIYDYKVDDSQKNPVSLSDYKGKTLLIVNVASRCGLTPQYKGLQELYSKYSNKDFEILAFPCNQFGAQEPGSNEEIKEFCDINFNVSFKIFDKINVNGSSASPLFKHLKNEAKGVMGSEAIKWNFTKFLIDNNGSVIKRYSPQTTPDKIDKDLSKILD